MNLVAGFALVAAWWLAVAYGRDVLACLRGLWGLVTDGAPERIERHPHLKALDALRGDSEGHGEGCGALDWYATCTCRGEQR